MKTTLLIVGLAIFVVGCAKAPSQKTTNDDQTQINYAPNKATKICLDGTTVYKMPDGNFAIEGANQSWIKLDDGVTPDSFCDSVKSKDKE